MFSKFRYILERFSWIWKLTTLFVFLSPLLGLTQEAESQRGQHLPIIDAHSQFDQFVDLKEIMELLNQGGISRIILSDRSTQGIDRRKELLEFAVRYPDRITPAVRTKGFGWNIGTDRMYSDFLNDQVKHSGYGAIAEVISTHAAMKNPFFELKEDVMIPPDDPLIRAAVKVAKKKGWPFLIHIEFRYIARHREVYMSKLEKLLSDYPSLPIGLMHMGQLETGDVRRLIEKYSNVFFMMSTCNTIIVRAAERNDPGRGWINIFEGFDLKPEWHKLLISYPDRFVVAFDNVFKGQWGPMYLQQIGLWRRALSQLPAFVADAVAHKNAERLWKLPPAIPINKE